MFSALGNHPEDLKIYPFKTMKCHIQKELSDIYHFCLNNFNWMGNSLIGSCFFLIFSQM